MSRRLCEGNSIFLWAVSPAGRVFCNLKGDRSGGMKDVISMLMQFLQTAADATGNFFSTSIHTILPHVVLPQSLVSTLGLLTVLSVLLGLAEVAKKVVWIIVIVGWILVIARITLIALG